VWSATKQLGLGSIDNNGIPQQTNREDDAMRNFLKTAGQLIGIYEEPTQNKPTPIDNTKFPIPAAVVHKQIGLKSPVTEWFARRVDMDDLIEGTDYEVRRTGYYINTKTAAKVAKVYPGVAAQYEKHSEGRAVAAVPQAPVMQAPEVDQVVAKHVKLVPPPPPVKAESHMELQHNGCTALVPADQNLVASFVGAVMSKTPKADSDGMYSARDVWVYLQASEQFGNWMKRRIKKYNLVEGEHYFPFNKSVKGDSCGYGNRKLIEYHVPAHVAYLLTMGEGKNHHQHAKAFIDKTAAVTEVAKQATAQIPQSQLNIMKALHEDLQRLANTQVTYGGMRSLVAAEVEAAVGPKFDSLKKIIEEKSYRLIPQTPTNKGIDPEAEINTDRQAELTMALRDKGNNILRNYRGFDEKIFGQLQGLVKRNYVTARLRSQCRNDQKAFDMIMKHKRYYNILNKDFDAAMAFIEEYKPRNKRY